MDGMKIFIVLIVSCFSMTEGQANAEFKYVDSCYSVGQTLTLEAVYTGSGTPVTVQWSYSGGTGTNLAVVPSTCTVFGAIPSGYPARMEYKCPLKDSLPANTYRLIVTGLTSDELTKAWGATFTPPTGTPPAADQKAISVCATNPTTYASTTPPIASPTPIPTSTTSINSDSSSTSTTTSSAVVPKPATTPSSGNETTVIIVSSVVGGLFFVGIVIAIVLILLSQQKKNKSVKHARNHRHHDQDGRQKRRDTQGYPFWQEYQQYNNISYEGYPGMGAKMNPMYGPYRSAHRGEQNYYLSHPSTDHQIYPRNHQIYNGGYNSNVRQQTDKHSNQQRYYGGRGSNNISNTLPRDENNYVAPDYKLYF